MAAVGGPVGCVRVVVCGIGAALVGVPVAVWGARGGAADPAGSMEQAYSAPCKHAVFISPPPHLGPRLGRAAWVGAGGPRSGSVGLLSPPWGRFGVLFDEIWAKFGILVTSRRSGNPVAM